ncbi:hypothetical protein U1Q18_028027 [Sarracenia purpurea var. burkii]
MSTSWMGELYQPMRTMVSSLLKPRISALQVSLRLAHAESFLAICFNTFATAGRHTLAQMLLLLLWFSAALLTPWSAVDPRVSSRWC